jgi:hypothetical protein
VDGEDWPGIDFNGDVEFNYAGLQLYLRIFYKSDDCMNKRCYTELVPASVSFLNGLPVYPAAHDGPRRHRRLYH